MTIADLDKRLDDAIEAYRETVVAQYSETGDKPVLESDICEVARQAYYVMSAMKDEIIRYLREA